MKAIKFLVAAMAVSFAMSANAKIFENNSISVNANFGSYGPSQGGFGIGAGFQTEFYTNDWITLNWDVLHIEWDAPFDSPANYDNLSFKTGCRAFSPSFAKDHLRAYTNLDLGYVLGIEKFGDETSTSSGFGLTFGIGLQYNKKWSLGYSLEYVKFKDVPGGKAHYATIAYTF